MMHQYNIKKISLCLALSLAWIPMVQAASSNWSIDPSRSKIEFFGSSNTHGFEGESQTINGSMQADPESRQFSLPVVINIPVEGFKTGNDARDHAMQHMFEMEKYPDIELSVQTIDLRENGRYRLAGDLKMHNVSIPVSIDVDVSIRPDGIEVKGQKELTTEMFGMKAPAMLGLFRVRKEVKVVFETYWKKNNG
jgi:polyisoprenoid-binding protein YceI